jgi:hypothetical protein
MQPGNYRATINLLHCLTMLQANGTWTIHVPRRSNIDLQGALYPPLLLFVSRENCPCLL